MTNRLARKGKEHPRATPIELRPHASLSWTPPSFTRRMRKARVGASDQRPDLANHGVRGVFTPRNRFSQHRIPWSQVLTKAFHGWTEAVKKLGPIRCQVCYSCSQIRRQIINFAKEERDAVDATSTFVSCPAGPTLSRGTDSGSTSATSRNDGD